MHPLEQLRDEINYLRFATTIDPQDKDRVLALVDSVEDAYPDDALPEDWNVFKSNLDTVLNGIRDKQVTADLLASFKSVENDLNSED